MGIAKASILVVDDEPHMRDMMTMVLTNDGFRVDAIADGREAIARLAENRYDLVVCDLMMPDVDGLEVLAQVKTRAPDALFILITAHASVESAVAALRQGAYDYLLKPFDMDELSLTVKRALSHRQLVLENMNLSAALLHQLRARDALFGVSQRIVTALDQQEVLKSILEATLNTIPQADLVVIHHYPTAESGLASVSLRADDAQRDSQGMAPAAAIDETLIQEAIRRQTSLYLPEHVHGPDDSCGTLMVLPMLLANTVMGTLSVVSEQPHAFSDDQQQLMAMLANQAAIALQNARLYAEARRIDELEALRDAGQAISQTLDLQQTLTTTISSACKLTGASMGEIYLREPTHQRPDSDVTLTRYLAGISPSSAPTEGDSPPTEADRRRAEIATQVASNRRPILIPNLTADEEASDTAHHPRAYLAVPLVAGDTLVGVLGVVSDRPDSFTTDDLRLMQVIAGQAATAIENARLFEEVERRWEQTEALRTISQSIITTLDLNQVLELVVRSVTATIPVAARSALYLLDQSSGEFTLEASASRRKSRPAHDIEEARDRVIRLATGQHIIAYEPNVIGQDGVWSLLAAPLKIGDTIIGAICLESPYAEAFSSDDQTLLSAFASQASIAIQNASLFRDLSSAYVDLASSREEILRSRNTLQALFDGITDGLYIVNQDMEIIAINQAEAQRLGVSPTRLQGMVCDESLWGEAAGELRRLVQLSLMNEQEQSWPSQASTPNRGPFADRDVHIYPIISTRGPARRAIIFAQDVSEMRQLQASLFRSANLVAIGQLAASIAHEINNPLTVTIGNAQLLQLDIDKSDPRYELTERIVQSGMRMRRIVQNLLDFSNQESYQFAWVELDETVEGALMLIAHPLRKDNIRVLKEMQGLPRVYASANHLKLVWMNLLLNARDAIHARNGEGEIRIKAESLGDNVRICITDNGGGIPPDHFEHLFRPFFTTKPPGKGLGLGLYTCHTIVSRHQGQIHVESQAGQGTTVCVTLPIQQTMESEIAAMEG